MQRDKKVRGFGQEPMAEAAVVVVVGWDLRISFWLVVEKIG